MVLGKKHAETIDQVNAAMDAPSKWLGPNHRRLFHSVDDIITLGMFSPDAMLAGMLHIMLDKNPALQLAMHLAGGNFKNMDVIKIVSRM